MLGLETSYNYIHSSTEMLRCIHNLPKDEKNSESIEEENNEEENPESSNFSVKLSESLQQEFSSLIIPTMKLNHFPCSNFRSFFHLARLENLFYDFFKKLGVIFIIGDGLQSGNIGVIVQA
jgi:hypothetical protein